MNIHDWKHYFSATSSASGNKFVCGVILKDSRAYTQPGATAPIHHTGASLISVSFQEFYNGCLCEKMTKSLDTKIILHINILYLGRQSHIESFPVYLRMPLILIDFFKSWFQPCALLRICKYHGHCNDMKKQSRHTRISTQFTEMSGKIPT